MGYKTKNRRSGKSGRSRKSRKMVQKGGFMNLDTLYKAIGMQSSTDEKKALGAVKDLEKLYRGLTFDQYGEEDKVKMLSMQKKILTAITTTTGDLEQIGANMIELETMMKETKPKLKDNPYVTKAHPTPAELKQVTPTLKAPEEARKPLDPAPAAEPSTSPEKSEVPATPQATALDTTKTGGKKSKKRRAKKTGRKAKGKRSKKYPRSKKHYNQKGGQKTGGCSPVITPAKVNPFQGFAWKGGNVSTWPGVGGTDGASNFYSPNQYKDQPDRFSDMVSGIYTQ